MSVIVIDGPEKAGKSTMVKALVEEFTLRGITAVSRHWGPVSEHDEYIEPMMHDVPRSHPVIWDRSWASEHVYAKLLNRDRILRDDPWRGEWFHGRAAASNGLRIMLVGPSDDVLRMRRSSDDLPVNPTIERQMFIDYAREFGWIVFNEVNETDISYIADSALWRMRHAGPLHIPVYAGPWNAPVVFVGEGRNPKEIAYSPFSSRLTSEYGRCLGSEALKCGWTNRDCDPDRLRGRMILACGAKADEWCKQNRLQATLVPHPAWLFRWGKNAGERSSTISRIQNLVTKGLKRHGQL